MFRVWAAIVGLMCVVAVGFVVYAVLARFVLHGPVTAGALAESVADAAGGGYGPGGDMPPSCQRVGGRARTWECTMLDAQSSGAVSYRVTTPAAGGSCWRARRFGAVGESMPETAGGCVHRWQWTLL